MLEQRYKREKERKQKKEMEPGRVQRQTQEGLESKSHSELTSMRKLDCICCLCVGVRGHTLG